MTLKERLDAYFNAQYEVPRIAPPLYKSEPLENEIWAFEAFHRVFLDLWTYPSPKKPDKEELVDLFGVFGDEAVLIEIKAVNRDLDPKDAEDWDWLYRKKVEDAVRQLNSAVSHLKREGEVFLTKSLAQKFPLPLPQDPDKLHLIVLVELPENYKDFAVVPRIEGEDHKLSVPSAATASALLKEPAPHDGSSLGKVQTKEGRGFVHVFSRVSFEALCQGVDTPTEFLDYLSQRVKHIMSGALVKAESERALIADFLARSAYDYPTFSSAPVLEDNAYEIFESSAPRQAQKGEDAASYFWDGIIRETAQRAFSATFSPSLSAKSIDYQLRPLASTTRYERRQLVTRMLFFKKNSLSGHRTLKSGVSILLIKIAPHPEISYEVFCESFLMVYLGVLRLRNPTYEQLLGIAYDASGEQMRIGAFLFFHDKAWTSETQALFREAAEHYPLPSPDPDPYGTIIIDPKFPF